MTSSSTIGTALPVGTLVGTLVSGRADASPHGADASPARESYAHVTYDLARRRAGDASSVLSIVGAAALFLPHEGGPMARNLIVASLAAGGLDTAIQGSRMVSGHRDATIGSTLYAATGLLPAASIFTLGALVHRPNAHEAYMLATLGANLALIGYELGHRLPRMERRTENVSGYLSFAAAFSGVIVRAKH